MFLAVLTANMLDATDKKTEKYIGIGKKHGLDLTEADIMYLRAFIKNIIREEITKARKDHGER